MGSTHKAIFVGDKPSKLNSDPNIPFIGSRCYPRLLSWIHFLLQPGDEYMLLNRTDIDFQLWTYLASRTGTPIIALGQVASKAIRYPHLTLPHPSGLNRQNNDYSYIKSQLEAVKRHLAPK